MRSGILLPPLLLAVGTAAILVGCTAATRPKAAETQAAESGTVLSTAGSGAALSAAESTATADTAASPAGPETVIDSPAVYPEAYSITYEVTDGQGCITTLRKVRDEDGNVYLQNGSEQSLFLWDGHAYHLYTSDSDGGFAPSGDAVAYTEAYVEDAAAFFAEYAEKGNDRFLAGAAEQGAQTCLDRNGTVYAINLGSDTNGMTCTFLVDNETGLCLSRRTEAQVGGFAITGQSDTLTCVEFAAEDVPDLQRWAS